LEGCGHTIKAIDPITQKEYTLVTTPVSWDPVMRRIKFVVEKTMHG
jgi:hypothetical protein